ncbi:hypothetical protein FB567DRAFT_576074 [Paraphoma chrysanthemicola]|uniref:Uncharacterized protein n=1 Tax=Paraphoma chrysanthemicola TaxID=798071 RepID=A0A8K0RG04_9PLEO|nr:hypothetical protein FB567DRAFT_576074 [Paraphoma chrysanthemicola]
MFPFQKAPASVSAYRIPNRSVFYLQLNHAHGKSKNIRVRRSYAPDHGKDCVEISIGQVWVSLADWLYKRYKSARSSQCSPSVYRYLIEQYVRERQDTDYDFWVRTLGMNIRLSHFGAIGSCQCILNRPNIAPAFLSIRHTPPTLSWPDVRVADLRVRFSLGIRTLERPFFDWLEMLAYKPPIVPVTQNVWWRANGKAFRFLDLPAELRLCIYRHISGIYTWLHIMERFRDHSSPSKIHSNLVLYDTACPKVSWAQWKHLDVRTPALDPGNNKAPFLTNLLKASRLIASEVWAFSMRHTIKHFVSPQVLGSVFVRIRTEHLRRISLGFSNLGYFNFVGLEASRSPRAGFENTEDCDIELLARIPTLFHLNFHFRVIRPRKVQGSWQSRDPWAFMGHKTGTDRISCQRIFVQWFLIMAYAHIEDIPRITLSGDISRSTRVKWEAIFEDACKGHRYDMSGLIQRIQSTPWKNLPPTCTCFHPCDWWNLHGPYANGVADPNFISPTTPWPDEEGYDPQKHDRFICED